ncbi:MAG: protein kinase [Zoogloeaceae bacterium]|jgi:serine/threonine protein kinase|nr:protein kinase [Zoogloeaceae bacterium]
MDSIGKYRIIRELGKGATASVYLCNDPDSNIPVAVKVVSFERDNVAVSRRLRKIFRTEGTISQRLDHPNIIRIHDAVVEEKRAYIAMEYVEGVSLEEYCRIDHLLPLHRVVGIVFKCCLALDYAYHQGIVHRDIKPANILLDKDDNPKIADFGLALNIHKDHNQDSTFIMGMGSPAYMSPEQVKGYPLNQKTDLYSLGVVLFQMLTGRLPFRAKNQATLVYKILNMDVPQVSQMNPNVPEKLDGIIKKALEKDLYNRYKNGAEFAKDLSTVRFKLVTGDEFEMKDDPRFEQLRRMGVLTEFENVELWELLRSATWKEVEADVVLFQEGDTNHHFGILVSGSVEVSMEGRVVETLNAGDIVGEAGYLHGGARATTIATLEPCQFLEINGSAISLSSEELQERMQQLLISCIITRLDTAYRRLGATGANAHAANSTRKLTPSVIPQELTLLPP